MSCSRFRESEMRLKEKLQLGYTRSMATCLQKLKIGINFYLSTFTMAVALVIFLPLGAQGLLFRDHRNVSLISNSTTPQNISMEVCESEGDSNRLGYEVDVSYDDDQSKYELTPVPSNFADHDRNKAEHGITAVLSDIASEPGEVCKKITAEIWSNHPSIRNFTVVFRFEKSINGSIPEPFKRSEFHISFVAEAMEVIELPVIASTANTTEAQSVDSTMQYAVIIISVACVVLFLVVIALFAYLVHQHKIRRQEYDPKRIENGNLQEDPNVTVLTGVVDTSTSSAREANNSVVLDLEDGTL